MAYSQANSISAAQEILLLPGKHQDGVDFHLQRKRSYVLEGKIIFSNGTTPKPLSEAMYSHDLQMYRSDQALISTGFGSEECDWDANAGVFRCYSSLPGTYILYFELSSGSGARANIPLQFAKVSYTV